LHFAGVGSGPVRARRKISNRNSPRDVGATFLAFFLRPARAASLYTHKIQPRGSVSRLPNLWAAAFDSRLFFFLILDLSLVEYVRTHTRALWLRGSKYKCDYKTKVDALSRVLWFTRRKYFFCGERFIEREYKYVSITYCIYISAH
jgi:hypothetical protein